MSRIGADRIAYLQLNGYEIEHIFSHIILSGLFSFPLISVYVSIAVFVLYTKNSHWSNIESQQYVVTEIRARYILDRAIFEYCRCAKCDTNLVNFHFFLLRLDLPYGISQSFNSQCFPLGRIFSEERKPQSEYYLK